MKKETEIRDQAASWIAQLDSDDITDADRLALREWANRSPLHLAELKRLGALWYDIDTTLSEEADDRLISTPSIGHTFHAAFKLRPGLFYKMGSGAAIFVMTVLTVFAVLPNFTEPSLYEATVATIAGEQRKYELPDGSVVHLNTNSLAKVEIDDTERTIRLIRGEAHFDVAHDESRPFHVHANGHLVKAVGTAFVVRMDAVDTSVIVTEGIVELAALSPPSDGEILSAVEPKASGVTRLVAGQSALVSENAGTTKAQIEIVTDQTIDRKLAWRDGLLVFDGESLSEVVKEVSRYTQSRIVILDTEIGDLPIGGSFNAGEVDALLRALEASFNIRVTRASAELIYLSKV